MMNTQTLVDQAQLLVDNENYEKALDLLKTAYEKDKNNTEVLEKLALLSKMLEDNEAAADYWEQLVNIDPNSLVAYSELQDIYLHQDKYKYYSTRAKVKILQQNVSQAVSDYKKALDNTTDEKEMITTRFLLAKAYEFLGKNANAIDEYFRILDHEDNISVYYKLAELYRENKDKNSAISVLERAIEAYPAENDFKEIIAGLYLETDNLDEALKYAQSDLTKSKIYLMQGNNEKAMEILENIEDKTSSMYLALMAEYYFNHKEFDKCKTVINEFRKKEPQNPLSYQMLALVADEQNDSFGAHYNWGRFHLAKSDSQMALSEFLFAHNSDNKNVDVINEIIKIQENLGEKHSIIEFYEKLAALEPNNENALRSLGSFYFDMYEFNNALEYFEKLIELKANDYNTFYSIARCYEKLKNNIEAKRYYKKYIDNAPLTPEVEALKEKISEMSDECIQEDEGFLEKLMRIFSK